MAAEYFEKFFQTIVNIEQKQESLRIFIKNKDTVI